LNHTREKTHSQEFTKTLVLPIVGVDQTMICFVRVIVPKLPPRATLD